MKDRSNVPMLKPLGEKRGLRTASFVMFCIECAYALCMLISGFNFLAVVAIALSLFFAIVILAQAVFKGYVGFWSVLSFIVSHASLLLYYYIWSADAPISRFLYSALFTLIPIGIAVFILFLPRISSVGGKRLIAGGCALVLAGASVFFLLAGSFRARPVVQSLKEGQDDYLNSLSQNGKRKPNVLFVLMDDMGYADISLSSYLGQQNATIKTPNIDSIAADGGIYMDNFYASSPVCSPSRFGILTGRYCARGYLDNVVFPSKVSLSPFGSTRFFNPFQFLNNVDGILGDEITFAEVLSASGYNTALFGKWNLGDYGEYLPTNQGFDYFFGSHYVNDMTPYNFVREQNGKFEEVYSHDEMKDQSLTTELLTDELNAYIRENAKKYVSSNGAEPFLAYYATPWPHAPLFSNANGNGKGDTTDDSYIKCIEEFDEFLGTALQTLKDEGIYDDTIIIFTSDNGPGKEGATGALKGRKNTTFEGGHKVPMLLRYNNAEDVWDGGVEKNGTRVISTSYMNTDIFPTLLELLDIPLPTDRKIDGVSMLPSLVGERGYNDAALTREGEPRVLYYLKRGKVQSLQMQAEADGKLYDFKYYLSVRNENSAFIDQMYKNYLFNLDLDPIEAYNVAMTYPQVASKLKAQLEAFAKELKTNRRGILK